MAVAIGLASAMAGIAQVAIVNPRDAALRPSSTTVALGCPEFMCGTSHNQVLV
jgi:hypothetical protein